MSTTKVWKALKCISILKLKNYLQLSFKFAGISLVLTKNRFLKEFSDFETKSTPEFRHPIVKAKVIQSRIVNKNARQDSSVDSDKHGINQIFTKTKKESNIF